MAEPRERTWQQLAALQALGAAGPSPDSLTLEETAVILKPETRRRLGYAEESKAKNMSLGKRARKTKARKTARREARSKTRVGENVENAWVFAAMQPEMNKATAMRLFGDDNPWAKKMRVENTLAEDIEAGIYWRRSLNRNPDLTPAEAQRLQDYYLRQLYTMIREDVPPTAGGRRRKRRRRKTRHRRRRIKKRKRKRTKRSRH